MHCNAWQSHYYCRSCDNCKRTKTLSGMSYYCLRLNKKVKGTETCDYYDKEIK